MFLIAFQYPVNDLQQLHPFNYNTIPSPPPFFTFPQLGHMYFEITCPSTAIKYDVAIILAGYLIQIKKCTVSGPGLFYTPYV